MISWPLRGTFGSTVKVANFFEGRRLVSWHFPWKLDKVIHIPSTINTNYILFFILVLLHFLIQVNLKDQILLNSKNYCTALKGLICPKIKKYQVYYLSFHSTWDIYLESWTDWSRQTSNLLQQGDRWSQYLHANALGQEQITSRTDIGCKI